MDATGYYGGDTAAAVPSPPPLITPEYEYAPPSEATYTYDSSPPSPPSPPPPDFSDLPDGACRDLAEGDLEFRSWLEKLQLVSGVLGLRYGEGAGATRDDVNAVAACGVYLRWVGTCVVRCWEDGGDQRLDVPAMVARDIFVALETASGELYTPGRSEVGEARLRAH